MDEALGMNRREPPADLHPDGRCLPGTERPSLENPGLQRQTTDPLHPETASTVHVGHTMDAHHVGVLDPGQPASFGEHVLAPGPAGPVELQRHVSLELWIP